MTSNSQFKSDIRNTQEIITQLKLIKYPIKPITNAFFIDKKLNKFNQKVVKKLKEIINPELNACRNVRGEGNCFFRAFAFSYIVNKKTLDFYDIFGSLDQINFQACKESSIPKEFKPFYNNKLLKNVFITSWKKQYPFYFKQSNNNYKRALSLMLKKNNYLDFIIILYFRSLCLYSYKNSKQQFKDFLKGTQIQQITQYGCQVQGLILKLCSKILQINIFIYQLRKNDAIEYVQRILRGNSVRNNIYLLFYDNHYDLLESNDQLIEQMKDQEEDQQYYQEVNVNYIQGRCFQCHSYSLVGEQNGLCKKCFNKNIEKMSKYSYDKLITEICGQCHIKKHNVSEQMLICQDCLNKMQFQKSKISSSENGNSKLYSTTKIPCLSCKKLKKQSELYYNQLCEDCKAQKDAKSFLRATNHNPNQSVLSTSDVYSLQNKFKSKINQEPIKKQEQYSDMSQVKKAKIFQKKNQIFYCINCQKQLNYDEQKLCQICLKYFKISEKNISSQIKNSPTSNSKTNICKICNQRDFYYKLDEGQCRLCRKIKKDSRLKSNIQL